MIAYYVEGQRYLEGGRDKTSRPIENNTRVERRGDDLAIKLHATDIAVIHPDDSITLDSGGWLTMTTKERMNRALGTRPVKIGSDRGVWFIYQGWQNKICRYFDGITISEHGDILNPRNEALEERLAIAEGKMGKSIDRFMDGYFETMEADAMTLPGGGDCWYCSMIVSNGVDKGKPLGDANSSNDHLFEHIKERYYVPSLLWNAMRVRGYRDLNLTMSMYLDRDSWEAGLMRVQRGWGSDAPDINARKELRHQLRKYLRKHLIPTRATQ